MNSNLFGRRPPRSCTSRAGGETREPDFLMYVCIVIMYIYIYLCISAIFALCIDNCSVILAEQSFRGVNADTSK